MTDLRGDKITFFNKGLFKLTTFVLIIAFTIVSFLSMVSPGWQKWMGDTYYYTAYFVKAKGLKTIEGSNYNFDDVGRMLKGFYQVGDDTYYFSEDGHALIGWQDIEDDKYFFTNEGIMLKNIFIEGHLLGSDGKAYKTVFLDIPKSKYLTTNGSHPTDPALDAKVDKILSSIITPEMDSYDRLHAVFNWIMENMRYAGDHVDMSNGFDSKIVEMVNYSLDYRIGICYHYAAVSQYMLERLGFQSIVVYGQCTAIAGGFTEHYWNMVAYEGQWYHFDPMMTDSVSSRDCFMTIDSAIRYKWHNWVSGDLPVSATKKIQR